MAISYATSSASHNGSHTAQPWGRHAAGRLGGQERKAERTARGLGPAPLLPAAPLEPLTSLFACFPSSVACFSPGSRGLLAVPARTQASHGPRSQPIRGLPVLTTFVSHHEEVTDRRIIWSYVSDLISPKHVLPFPYLGPRQWPLNIQTGQNPLVPALHPGDL